MRPKDEDEVVDLYFAHTLDHVLFFTNRGRVYGERVFALPDAGRGARGLPMINYLNLAADERVTTLLVAPDFAQAEFVTMLTRLGRIKRVKLSEFASVRPSGIIAMNLEPGDELGWVRATHGNQDYIIVTGRGRALRYNERLVRAMGRTAAGVLAIRLGQGDAVAAFDIVEPGGDLLLLTERGWGKRAPLAQFPIHSRNSQGVWALAHSRVDETGKIVAARVVQPKDQVSIITAAGVALRTPVATISQQSRTTRGVRIVNLDANDVVAAMARVSAAVEEAEDRPSDPPTPARTASPGQAQQEVEKGQRPPQPAAQESPAAERAVISTSGGADDPNGNAEEV
jgi:DNA gyrase subunit A